MKAKLAVILAAILLTGVFAGCGSDDNAASADETAAEQNNSEDDADATEDSGVLISLRVGAMVDMADSYVVIVGQKTGIFEKYGLDVEGFYFSQGIESIDGVTLGQLDIGQAADFAILSRIGNSAENPLRIFTVNNYSKPEGTELLVPADSGIEKPEDLAGKSVNTSKGTVIEYWWEKLFEVYDMDPESVELLPVSSNQEGNAIIASGQSFGTWLGGQGKAQLEETTEVVSLGDLNLIDAATMSVGVVSEEFLEEHPGVIEKFLQAKAEIQDYIDANEEEAAKIISEETNASEEQVINNLSQIDYAIGLQKDVIATLKELYEWIEANDIITNPYDLNDYLDYSGLANTFPDTLD